MELPRISDTLKRQFRIIHRTPRTDYSHWDIEGLLDAQRDAGQKEHDKVMMEIFEEIEVILNKTISRETMLTMVKALKQRLEEKK